MWEYDGMSRPNHVLVSVDIADADDLAELTRLYAHAQSEDQLVDVRSLGGETVVSALVLITAGTLPYLRGWILARAEARKHTSITLNGLTIKGYTAHEAQRLISALDEHGAALGVKAEKPKK